MAKEIDQLNERGLWNGPNDFISQKLIHAYQLKNTRAFQGIFPKDTFEKYPDFQSTNNTLYLGKRSELFEPVVGRDKIRGSDNELKVLESLDELAEALASKPRKARTPKTVSVQKDTEKLTVYHLDHSLQQEIITPDSFEEYEIVFNGIGPVGIEIAAALMKMGAQNLRIHDSTEVDVKDPAVSIYRAWDPKRARAVAAHEILAEQGLQGAKDELESRIQISQQPLDTLGNIVINTASDRKAIWEKVKGSSVALYVDIQIGVRGNIFAFAPSDPKGVETYEASLGTEYPGIPITADIVKMFAAFGAGAVRRYVATPSNEKANVLDRMYPLDIDAIYRDAGIWGKTA